MLESLIFIIFLLKNFFRELSFLNCIFLGEIIEEDRKFATAPTILLARCMKVFLKWEHTRVLHHFAVFFSV